MFEKLFSRFAPGPDPHAIDHDAFAEAVQKGECVVVDVRETHEFAQGHIPTSANMPLSSFDPRRLPLGKPIVLICRSGMRSANALHKALAHGRDDIRHYAHGIVGWMSRSGPLSR